MRFLLLVGFANVADLPAIRASASGSMGRDARTGK
jgi:hypothetical protein